ncbi:solute carrier family 22 member 16-like [Dermacentor andersoni]|uniref:solute carrier family 22 member 16-like n=1 Tax=Dermacentor andersoni TaxID=34620 RepID=UPI003B3B6749
MYPMQIGLEEERRVVNCHNWEYDIGSTEDSIVSNYDLVCGRRWLYQCSSLVYMMGAMPFAPLAGVLSDRWGRKPVIMATVSALQLATLCTAMADTLVLFLLARFFECAACSSSTLILFTLLYEVTGDERRAAYSVWATGLAAIMCPPFLALVALFEPRWMLSQVIIVVPTVALAACCLLLDESPSWLLATCRLRDAERVLLAAAKCNGQDEGTARTTFTALKQQIKRHQKVSESTIGNVPKESVSCGAVVQQEHIVPVSACWFTLNFGYYAIELRSLAPRTPWVQAAHLLLQFVFYVRAARTVVGWGYRGTLTLFLGLLCLCTPVHVVAVFHQNAMLVSLCGVLVACGCAAAMSVTYGYTTEVFPTALRATGLCVSYSFDRLGALLAVASTAASSHRGVLAVDGAAAAMMFVCLAVVRWLPEVFLKRRRQHRLLEVPRKPEERREARKASLSQNAGTRKKSRSRSASAVTE